MSLGQGIILCFLISLLLFLAIAIFETLVEEDIKFKTDVNKLRKNNRKLAEEWEKQEFLFKLYHGIGG